VEQTSRLNIFVCKGPRGILAALRKSGIKIVVAGQGWLISITWLADLEEQLTPPPGQTLDETTGMKRLAGTSID
jgi:hypothetical protein